MKVSILSAVHNEERFLLDMVDSVCLQSHEDWELLLVDDGSTDRTSEKIAVAVARDDRVTSVGDGAKQGKVAAFNAAYGASRGDVIVLLGGDDLLPVDSLAIRVQAFLNSDVDEPVAACFKLRTLSESKAHDGVVLPKGEATSKSGGVVAMTRPLADLIFPIDPALPSEDLWIGELLEELSVELVKVPEVVLHYRIHSGNSNPRMRSFGDMDRSMASRHRVYEALRMETRFSLSRPLRERLEHLSEMESLRSEGRTTALVRYSQMPLADRLGFAAMSDHRLFAVRQRLFKVLSGLRGQ